MKTQNEWPEKGTTVIAVMSSAGDTKLVYTAGEEQAAADKFAELVASGHLPFKLDGDGSGGGDQLDKFTPGERVLMVPQMKGG